MPYTLNQHLTYSVWANSRVVETLRPLDEKLLYEEVKSSFSSIAKTMLHMWDAETIWLKRIQGVSLEKWPSENFGGTREELFNGFIQSPNEIVSFIGSKPAEFLKSKVSYKNMKGDPFENVVEDLLYHVVNHGTYHRGQITTMLRMLGVENILSTDIIFYIRFKEAGQKASK